MGAQGTAVVDFGTGKLDTSVVVTSQASILASSLAEAWLSGAATVNNLNDAAFAEELEVFASDIVAGAGFTIYVFCRHGLAFGQFTVYWCWN